MNTLLLEQVEHAAEVVPLTVDQYHRMLEVGILAEGEPIELLDGLLVPKDRGEGMTVNPFHRLVVSRLMRRAPRLEELGCHLQLQSPLTIEPNHEPEPDAMIVRGNIENYVDRHPEPGDVSCVIEVSQSSLERDRTTKRRIYATAGIGQYVIFNLVDRQAEVYEQPLPAAGRFDSVEILNPGDSLLLRIPDRERFQLPISSLLG